MPRGRNRQQADPEMDVTPGSRLHQMIEWLDGQGGDCMIVLDGAALARPGLAHVSCMHALYALMNGDVLCHM